MDSYTVVYFDNDGCETKVEVEADDAAAALGLVLDECADIAPDSPFAVMNTSDEDDPLDAISLQSMPEAGVEEVDGHALLARIFGDTGCKLEN